MDDAIDLPPEEPDENDSDGLLDRARNMPVGTRDPNIIGDAGPMDVPPGSDPVETETGSIET